MTAITGTGKGHPMTITDAQPAEPVPVAWLGRTSILVLQDPAASLRRQLRNVEDKLPPGWFIAAHFWDVESGGLDLDQRGHGTGYDKLHVDIPATGAGGAARRSEVAVAEVRGGDMRGHRPVRPRHYNALRLEKELSA